MQSENCLGGELISDRAQKEVNKGNRKLLIISICFLKVIGHFPDFKHVLLYLFFIQLKGLKRHAFYTMCICIINDGKYFVHSENDWSISF